MTSSSFLKNLIGLYGIAALPLELVKQYERIYLLQSFVRGFQYYEGPRIIGEINNSGVLGEDGFVVANVNEMATMPDQIASFEKILDKQGRYFYEVIFKSNTL